MSDEVKGIWIPMEILELPKLSLQEKVFLSQIAFLNGENGCTASNDYFAELFKLSKDRASEIINSLKKKRKISVRIYPKMNNKRVIKSRIKIAKLGIPKNADTLSVNPPIGIGESADRYPEKRRAYIKEENIIKTEIKQVHLQGPVDELKNFPHLERANLPVETLNQLAKIFTEILGYQKRKRLVSETEWIDACKLLLDEEMSFYGISCVFRYGVEVEKKDPNKITPKTLTNYLYPKYKEFFDKQNQPKQSEGQSWTPEGKLIMTSGLVQ